MFIANQNSKNIGKWISILHRQSQIYLTQELKPYGLNSSEYIYLVNLSTEGEVVNQKQLTDMIIVDNALTTRALNSLEKKGYIIREKSKVDQRAYHIMLTEKGINVQPRILEILENWTNSISQGMNESERKSMIQSLMGMSDNAVQITKGNLYG